VSVFPECEDKRYVKIQALYKTASLLSVHNVSYLLCGI
jgi:hypothetical protein